MNLQREIAELEAALDLPASAPVCPPDLAGHLHFLAVQAASRQTSTEATAAQVWWRAQAAALALAAELARRHAAEHVCLELGVTTVDQARMLLVHRTLAACDGNKTRAAALLGSNRRSLYNWLDADADACAVGDRDECEVTHGDPA